MTTKKKRRGLAPDRATVQAQVSRGYLTASAAAKRAKVSEALVRKWIRQWAKDSIAFAGEVAAHRKVRGLLCTYKDGANVWVLAAAVEARAASRRGSPVAA